LTKTTKPDDPSNFGWPLTAQGAASTFHEAPAAGEQNNQTR
jgi:hypothetical protein